MWEQRETFNTLGVSVLTLTFELRQSAETYQQNAGASWPLLIDEQCNLYNRYNMYRSGFFDIWGPRTWWAYVKELLKGKLPKPSAGDIRQRGGDVLIDDKGIVRFHHVGMGPADRPSIKSIIDIVRKG